MTLAIILCFLLWSGTLVFAFWWAERRYQDGYHEGYSDAEEWAQRSPGVSASASAETFFGGEP